MVKISYLVKQGQNTWEGMFSQATRSVNYWIFNIAFPNLQESNVAKKVSKWISRVHSSRVIVSFICFFEIKLKR